MNLSCLERNDQRHYQMLSDRAGVFEHIIDLLVPVDENRAEAEFRKGGLTVKPRILPPEQKKPGKRLLFAVCGRAHEKTSRSTGPR